MIEVEGVRKVYGRTVAVDGVSFTVAPGELVGLIGRNGAGKTTLLRMLAGQLLPTAGRLRVGGADVVADPAAARERLGYVPEVVELWDYLTARELLEFVVDVRGRGEVADGLRVANLGEDADRLIREYSQGMRRRVALAAALVSAPPAVVLDEALNGLDPPSAAGIKEELRRARDAGAAILLSTHVTETLERLADRVIRLDRGRVVADLRVADLPPGGLEALFAGEVP